MEATTILNILAEQADNERRSKSLPPDFLVTVSVCEDFLHGLLGDDLRQKMTDAAALIGASIDYVQPGKMHLRFGKYQPPVLRVAARYFGTPAVSDEGDGIYRHTYTPRLDGPFSF